MGELTDRAKAAGNKIAGGAKQVAGEVTGNDKLKAEGAAQSLKGDVQNVSGKVKGALGDDV
ncbi:CsbD family protein [Novosphingobium cyanobacteriorum]|uniref:CsbD family protein n=1 Tax=Novosphingobium cyanobacteriorum TaxID=3024215 RepID=A0ABT6CLK9_9SPHN|nr:CsbD family protein [Novosphingobium cyanobacteriorum]MDF8334805.1 CsbD family protein [Novosphingobium cyanobacteriorum]